MLSALIAKIEAQNQTLVQAVAPNQYRLPSRWLNWEVFTWAFLHGRFGIYDNLDGLVIRFSVLNTSCRSYYSGQFSFALIIYPDIPWQLFDEFGEQVLGIKDFSSEFIPF